MMQIIMKKMKQGGSHKEPHEESQKESRFPGQKKIVIKVIIVHMNENK